jgi:CheY-like chemotaxis protein
MTLEREYVLIVDDDADRVAAAVRGCGEAFPGPTLVARSVDDAIRLLRQLGPPAVLMAALTLPDGDGLSVIEALRCIDENAAVIAWAADRELREYAASRIGTNRAKVLGRVVSPDLCRRCVDALLHHDDASKATIAAGHDDAEENWLDLAESARQRLGVVGAAAYTKTGGAGEYTMSVSWLPDSSMLNFPTILPSALEEVLASGVARMWTEGEGAASHAALRSVAIAPLVRDRETAGALCVFDSSPHAFRQDDLETLIAIAGGPTTPRRGVPAIPIERDDAEAVIKRELARAGRDQRPMSVLLFAVSPQPANEVPAVDDILARVVRGNDLVVRWTTSEVVVVLAGVDNGVAERVADRISDVVQTAGPDRIAVSRAVAELGNVESFEDTIARAAATIRNFPSSGPSGEGPRLSAPSRGYRATSGTRRNRPRA